MKKNACIVFGISTYEDAGLAPLPGARVDAERVYAALLNANIVACDEEISSIQINVTRNEARHAIAEAAYNEEIENLSIYFAGHGGSNNSGYFLCCKDCDEGKIAYSALSLSDIFTILSESPMKQVNLIIDACNAGGLAQDLSTLSRNPQMGATAGMSISIIALSSRDEVALEDTQGGFGTTAFLTVIEGHADNHSNKKFLSLGDVSQAIEMQHLNQTPSFWSFNITGAPRFCRNIYAANNRQNEIFSLPALSSTASSAISQNAAELIWKNYLDIASDFDARHLQTTLETILKGVDSPSDAASLLLGLFDSFRERVGRNDDAFATVTCCAVFLFVTNDLEGRAEEAKYILCVLLDELKIALSSISEAMHEDAFFLVRDNGGHSDFFTLPQRISNLGAWALLASYLDVTLNNECAQSSLVCNSILDNLTQNYSSSFELMSENQAPAITLISCLSSELGAKEWANGYLAHLYFSFFQNRRMVAKADLDAEDVYDFLKQRLLEEKPDCQRFCARPTEVIFALMCHYWKHGNLDIIRYDFADLDGMKLNAYVPDSYAQFSAELINEGSNLGFHIGFDIFTLDEFRQYMETHFSENVRAASVSSTTQELLVAAIASLIYPDRMPWYLALGKVIE